MVYNILRYLKNPNYINIIVIALIILFIIKVISLSIYIYYEKELSKKITNFKNIVEENFTALIDIETIKSAFIDGKYDETFVENNFETINAIFTKELIIQLIKKNGKTDVTEMMNNYVKDTNNKSALHKIITRYYEISSEIDNSLLDNYDDKIILSIDQKRIEIDNKFTEVYSFIKSQRYPINVMIDTCIIVLMIIAFVAYIIYYKIHSLLLIIIFVISVILLIFYQSNTLILIMAFSGFYTAYFFKLYQIIKSNQQQ